MIIPIILFFSGILLLLLNKKEDIKFIKKHEQKLVDDGFEEGIDQILEILRKHDAYEKHNIIVQSMILLLMSRREPRYNLENLVPENSNDLIFSGRQYIDRFTSNVTETDCFFVGVIENEIDSVRIGRHVPVQYVYEIRKIVDSFYHKNLQ